MSTALTSPLQHVASQLDLLRQRRSAAAPRREHDVAHGTPTLLCASGRGGQGTTLLAALLAVAAAGDGYRVLLVDTDEHVGPLSMLLGVHARGSWLDVRGGQCGAIDVATPLSTTLTFVAGGPPRRTAGSASPLTSAERRACLRRVSALAQHVDLVVMDCGARFETVMASVTPHNGERLLAITANVDPIGLAATYALCKAVHARHEALPIDVLVNRHDGDDAIRCFEALDAGARQFLGCTLGHAGAIPTDSTLDAALRAGMLFPDAAAGSPAAIAAHEIVMRTILSSSSRKGV